jgi:hypothetical protein
MKNLKINKVVNRLGNFIKQVRNAVQVALFYNYNLILPKHKYFNTTYIIINPDVTLENPCITDRHEFFFGGRIQDIDSDLFNKNKQRTIEVLRECFLIKNSTILDSNDLLIHMRSGDIFSKPHPNYIMPPVSYYENIIENNTFNDIYLIAEDKVNPCIHKLIELYPKIKFTVQSLDNDIDLILGASNVVMSYGSFIPSLLIMSDKIKKIYSPSYATFEFHIFRDSSTIHIESGDLEDYRSKQFPFKNRAEQRDRMLTYKVKGGSYPP